MTNKEEPTPAKRHTLPLQIALAVVLVGALFNAQHWPGAKWILLGGLSAIMLLYPLRYAVKRPKRFMDHAKLVLATSWPLSYALAILHLPYAWITSIVASIAFFIWLFGEGVASFWQDDQRAGSPSTISIVMYALSFIFVVGGTIFRVQHWPYGIPMILCGLGCAALWFAVEFLLGKKGADKEGKND